MHPVSRSRSFSWVSSLFFSSLHHLFECSWSFLSDNSFSIFRVFVTPGAQVWETPVCQLVLGLPSPALGFPFSPAPRPFYPSDSLFFLLFALACSSFHCSRSASCFTSFFRWASLNSGEASIFFRSLSSFASRRLSKNE